MRPKEASVLEARVGHSSHCIYGAPAVCPAPCWAPAAGPVDICAPRLGHVTVSRRRKALHQILAQPLTDREPGQAPLRLWKASFLSHMGLWEASALSPEPGVVLWVFHQFYYY